MLTMRLLNGMQAIKPTRTSPLFIFPVLGLICGFRLANKAWLKVADLAALAGQYQRAIERYESVARASLNSNLSKWSVKDYFFKAGACYLANKVDTPAHCPFSNSQDLVSTKSAIERFIEQDPTFASTRE